MSERRGDIYSQGGIHIERRLDGRYQVEFRCPRVVLLTQSALIDVAIQILKQAGVEAQQAHPGQTVVIPPGKPTKRLFTAPK